MTSPDVYVVLGSNINPHENMQRCVELLRQQCTVLQVSSVYRTPPEEFEEQDDFLNAVVKLHTDKTPLAFKLEIIGGIEQTLKRVRDPNNIAGPRTIDLDISLWGDEVFDYGDKPWHVPDKDVLKYAYVTVPLAELSPDLLHPETGERMVDIAFRLDATGIEKIDLDLNAMPLL